MFFRPGPPLTVEGPPRSQAALLLSLAAPGQILLTKTAFDLARRAMVGSDSGDAQTGGIATGPAWLDHGPYRFDPPGVELEVFEVGEPGRAPLAAPPEAQSSRRPVSTPERQARWTPEADRPVPHRPSWVLEGQLGAPRPTPFWLGRHRKTGERRVFRFALEEHRLPQLRRQLALFQWLKGSLSRPEAFARILDWNFDQPPYTLESGYTEGGKIPDWAETEGGLAAVPWATRLDLVLQTADAMASLHQAGVAHGMVTPDEILVHQKGGETKIRFVDYGLGRLLHTTYREMPQELVGDWKDPPGTVSPRRRRGAEEVALGYLGRSEYRAPELDAGADLSAHTDIYGLGMLLYHLAVGDLTVPFGPFWERRIDDPEVRRVVAAMLDPNPEVRPEDAAAAVELLRQLRPAAQAPAVLEPTESPTDPDPRGSDFETEADDGREPDPPGPGRSRWWWLAALILLAALAWTALRALGDPPPSPVDPQKGPPPVPAASAGPPPASVAGRSATRRS